MDIHSAVAVFNEGEMMKRWLKQKWWWLKGHCVWHHADWWFANFHWTGVNRHDMPDRLISKWEFWARYSPMNGC